MWTRITQWWKAQGELAKLQGVSDRILADMGLKREDLRDRVLARTTNPETQSSCACLPTTVLAHR
jgi:uncharacterized protein YjiS (DUF1127 family)